jgi:PDZ domain-containing protein
VARLFKLLLASGLVLGIIAVGLYIIPSDQYIFLPDEAQPLAPYVKVEGEKPARDGGGIYYVAVEVKKASVLEKLFHGLHEGSTLVPAAAIRAPGESDEQHRQVELQAMAESQKVGAAVALRSLGYKVPVTVKNVAVAQVASDGPSAGKLEPGDVILAVDGTPTKTVEQIRREVGKREPGEPVQITVRRDGARKTLKIKTISSPKSKKTPIIGVFLQPVTKIALPVPVHIDLGQVGGPSAGLAFALDVVEELGHDIDHGRKVAASGELLLDGTVVPVGGLKQKTIGAKEAGADVFLVPAGENARDARRYAGDMRVIPVKSFQQALQALRSLS